MTLSEQGIVDTHVHLWQLRLAERAWLTPEHGRLYRSIEPEDLARESNEVGVRACVFVEAGKTVEEDREMERMAASSDLIAAIMPNVDLESPNLDKALDYWQSSPKFRGVRMGFEGHPDPGVVARPSIVQGLGKFAERALVFEFLVRSPHLSDVLNVYERYPELKGVINHMAKPDMVEKSDSAEWHRGMRDLARNTSIFCKLSLSPRGELIAGIAANPRQGWPVASIRPYVQFLLEEFGPGRLMWGSDWPIALITSDYKWTYDAMREAVGPVSAEDEMRLFSTNAVRFYGLE